MGDDPNSLFCWWATLPNGSDGVCAGRVPGLPGLTPLMGRDRDQVEGYRDLARAARDSSGCSVRLVRLRFWDTLEELA
jgi:hypothetical protein